MIEVKAGQKYRCPLHGTVSHTYPNDVFFIIDSVDEFGTVWYRYAPESEWYPEYHNGLIFCRNPLRVIKAWIENGSMILVQSEITIET